MRPLDDLHPDRARAVSGVLFDMDDTFLDGFQLNPDAYRQLFALKEAGLRLVVATGRPASWATVVARMWPIDGAIAENGAVAFYMTPSGLVRSDTATLEQRHARRQRLAKLVEGARRRFPDLKPADDVEGRDSDYTFDIGEHQRAPAALVEAARLYAEERGARTTRSSVHLHYTFDRHDKATGALRYLQARFGLDPTRARRDFAYVGDSQNDAPCFAGFELTIGVANVSGSFSLPPRFVTQNPRARGFCEAAEILIAKRNVGA